MTRLTCLFGCGLLIGFSGNGGAQEPEQFQISVNVNLVVLPATVQDRSGLTPTGLTAEDFEVYEDGVRQSIRLFRHDDTPVAAGLVVDHSGSMRHKIPDVVAAAQAFARSSSPADQMFVVNFNEHVTLGLPTDKSFSDIPTELGEAISGAAATGQTALYDAITSALEHLQTAHQDKKVLIVISDGGDNASRHTLEEALRMAERSGALVYTIGIYDEGDPDRNPKVLRHLAQATGGEAFFPLQTAEAVTVCERIARDIRGQYTLGYESNRPPHPGAYRQVRVVAHAPGMGHLTVRTRAGYFEGSK